MEALTISISISFIIIIRHFPHTTLSLYVKERTQLVRWVGGNNIRNIIVYFAPILFYF